jgi:hypothetical protein
MSWTSEEKDIAAAKLVTGGTELKLFEMVKRKDAGSKGVELEIEACTEAG